MIGKCKDCAFCKWAAKHARWLLRLSLAAVFLYHGLPKFQDLAGFATMAHLPLWVATLVALGEVGGSLLILLGGAMHRDSMTRLGGLALVPVMAGAIVLVHWPNGWNFMNGGIEFQVTLLAIALYFVFTGNGSMGCCSTGKK